MGIKILENSKVNEKLDIFKGNKTLMTSIIEVFYKRLIFLYERNSSILYKYITLIILEKIIIFSSSQDLIQNSNFSLISQFLYRLLNTIDLMIIVLTLLIIDAFLNKTPSILNELTREGVSERINCLKNESELNKLLLIPLQRGQKDYKLLANSVNHSENGLRNSGKYESVAEKMRNLNSLINRIDKNINDIYQPKLISNIKTSQVQELRPEINKKNMLDSMILGKKSENNNILDKSQESFNKLSENKDNNLLVNDYQTTKMSFIRRDLLILLTDLCEKVRNVASSKGSLEQSSKIQSFLTEITSSFKQQDYGQEVFEKMLCFLNKYKKFTNYELKTHKLFACINEFLLEGCLNVKNMDICDERSELLFQNMENYEFSRGTENEPFPEIEVSEEQTNKIAIKLFVFVGFLLNKNPANPTSA